MAKMSLIENGITKAVNPRRRKRRNTTTVKRRNPVAKTANPRRRRRRRNPATAYGMASVANAPRRRRRRRNPVVKKANPRHRRNGIGKRSNGIFGNSKETVTAVLALSGGMIGTKIVAGLVSPFAARLLTPVGLGNFTQVIVQGALALVVASPIATKLAGRDAGKFAMFGGLTITALDIIDLFLPDSIPLNPFNSVNMNPIIVGAGADAAVNGLPAGQFAGSVNYRGGIPLAQASEMY